ncbi:CZB domain-containing protein [Allopseudospirillum japonicum]
MYKQNGYAALAKQETDTDLESRIKIDHTQCRLGHWYYEGNGFQHFKHTSHYARLEKPHRCIHEGIQHALTKAHQYPVDVEYLMSLMRDVEACSDQVLDTIDHMIGEHHQACA